MDSISFNVGGESEWNEEESGYNCERIRASKKWRIQPNVQKCVEKQRNRQQQHKQPHIQLQKRALCFSNFFIESKFCLSADGGAEYATKPHLLYDWVSEFCFLRVYVKQIDQQIVCPLHELIETSIRLGGYPLLIYSNDMKREKDSQGQKTKTKKQRNPHSYMLLVPLLKRKWSSEEGKWTKIQK